MKVCSGVETLPMSIEQEQESTLSNVVVEETQNKEDFQHSSSETTLCETTEEDIVETLPETLKELYYKKKNEKGELEALFTVGKDYHEQEKYDQAVKFFKKGALLGHDSCEGFYGFLLFYGYGTEKNEKLAVEYFTKASKTILTYPFYFLGKILNRKKLYKEAIEQFRIGCANNCPQCQLKMGKLLCHGSNVEIDLEQAEELFLKSAKEYKQAKLQLGKLYCRPEKRNMEMKNYWYTKYYTNNISKLEFVKDSTIEMVEEDKAHSQFEQDEEELSKEVIVRFESTDFILTVKELKTSFVLSCMISPNWKDYNQMEEDRLVIDMRSIQNEILNDSSTNVESTFENYVKYLRKNGFPKNFDDKINVILLADYLLDEKCIRGIEYSNCLVKFYILSQLRRVDNDHIAKASFFIHSDSMGYLFSEYSEKMFEYLLSESDLGAEEKFKLSSLYLKLFQAFPTYPLKLSKFPLLYF